jgi:rod shape-determining protein MreD
MRFSKWILIYLVVIVLHWLFATYLSVSGIGLNIGLISSIVAGVLATPATSISFAFFSGLYIDFVGDSLFGVHAFIYTALVYGIWYFRKRINLDDFLSQMVFVTIVSFGAIVLKMFLSLIVSGQSLWAGWAYLLLVPVINGMVSPLFFIVFRLFIKQRGGFIKF